MKLPFLLNFILIKFINCDLSTFSTKLQENVQPLHQKHSNDDDINEFKANIFPDTERHLVKNGICLAVREFKLLDMKHFLHDCELQFVPIKFKAKDQQGKDHILPAFLNNFEKELKPAQNESNCKKIKR